MKCGNIFGHGGDEAFRHAYDNALNDIAGLIERHGELIGLPILIFAAGRLAAEEGVLFEEIVDAIKTVMDAHTGESTVLGSSQRRRNLCGPACA